MHKRLSPEKIGRIRELKEMGYTVREIASLENVTAGVISKYARGLGLKLDRRRRMKPRRRLSSREILRLEQVISSGMHLVRNDVNALKEDIDELQGVVAGIPSSAGMNYGENNTKQSLERLVSSVEELKNEFKGQKNQIGDIHKDLRQFKERYETIERMKALTNLMSPSRQDPSSQANSKPQEKQSVDPRIVDLIVSLKAQANKYRTMTILALQDSNSTTREMTSILREYNGYFAILSSSVGTPGPHTAKSQSYTGVEQETDRESTPTIVKQISPSRVRSSVRVSSMRSSPRGIS